MTIDKIEMVDNTVFQHGKHSDRIYLMSLDAKNTGRIINLIESLAETNNYTKIIVKVPERSRTDFIANDYIQEALIPDMYHGIEDGYFMSKYLNTTRSVEIYKEAIDNILENALNNQGDFDETSNDKREVIKMTLGDVQEMAEFYYSVFESYPFPIFDPEYLAKTMHEDVEYFGIRDEGKLIALASAEIDIENSNAEATDFAVLKEYRRQGLAQQLLVKIEEELKGKDIQTYYTIARALSPGMNKAFAKLGYKYAGTLTNNTGIAGSIESMNVWYKTLN
ncbi:MAG: putative beta-lysine N-acetyltransferase [Firmicutes bacterium]|nr:putative beta-lysine N-acetyltransferase [Bacillota bacterium]